MHDEHQAIVLAIAPCLNLQDMPVEVINYHPELALRVWTASRYGYFTVAGENEYLVKPLKLTNLQRSMIHLSNAISRARFDIAQNADKNNRLMNRFQIATIFIGAITTILVSIKAMSITNAGQSFWIGVAAIIFTAAGTAASSLNSFYSPRDAYVRTERSLSALRQLHMEVASEIINSVKTDQNNCPQMNEDTNKIVKDLYTRLGTILNTSETSPQGEGQNPPGDRGNTSNPVSVPGGGGKAANQ